MTRLHEGAARHRLPDGHDFFINGDAQLVVGRMETAVRVAKGYGGRVVQPSVGVEVTRKALAAFVQADYRVAPARPDALSARVADVRGLRLVLGSGCGCGVRGQADASPHATPAAVAAVHRNPRVEVAVGANGPQYWTAEFPGINFSLAANVPGSRNWGAALVVEGDASYVRGSRAAGARLFARTSSVESGGRGTTAWVQLLGGHRLSKSFSKSCRCWGWCWFSPWPLMAPNVESSGFSYFLAGFRFLE